MSKGTWKRYQSNPSLRWSGATQTDSDEERDRVLAAAAALTPRTHPCGDSSGEEEAAFELNHGPCAPQICSKMPPSIAKAFRQHVYDKASNYHATPGKPPSAHPRFKAPRPPFAQDNSRTAPLFAAEEIYDPSAPVSSTFSDDAWKFRLVPTRDHFAFHIDYRASDFTLNVSYGAMHVNYAPHHIPDVRSDWIVDSGATATCTPNKSFFRASAYTPCNMTLTVGNGGQLPVLGYGPLDITVQTRTPTCVASRPMIPQLLSLPFALHCPALQFNLLSVRHSTAAGYKLNFDNPEHCLIDLGTSHYFRAPVNTVGLYSFVGNPPSTEPSTPTTTFTPALTRQLYEKFKVLIAHHPIGSTSSVLLSSVPSSGNLALSAVPSAPPAIKEVIDQLHIIYYPGVLRYAPIFLPPSSSTLYNDYYSLYDDSTSTTTPSVLLLANLYGTPSISLVQDATTSILPECALTLAGDSRLSNEALYSRWHHRLGHPSPAALRDLIHGHPELSTYINRKFKPFECDVCEYAKSRRKPFSSEAVFRAKSFLTLVHSDIWGPCPVPSIGGSFYFVIFIDDFSRFTWIYPLPKRQALYETYEKFRLHAMSIFKHDVSTLHYSAPSDIGNLQTDNAKEFEKLGRLILSKYHTKTTFSNAYSPSQNAVAERHIGIIVMKTRALLLAGDLPKSLWAEAAIYSAWLYNVSPSSTNGGESPYFRVFSRHPPLGVIKTFGCTAFVHIQKPVQVDKLDPRALKTMFIGLPDDRKGYKLLHLHSHELVYSRDVTFWEDTFPTINTIDAAILHRQKAKEPNYVPQLHPNAPLPSLHSLFELPYSLLTSINLSSIFATMDISLPLTSPLYHAPVTAPTSHFPRITPPFPSAGFPLDLTSTSVDVCCSDYSDLHSLSTPSASTLSFAPPPSLSTLPLDPSILPPLQMYALLGAKVPLNTGDPTTWKEAMRRPDRDQWLAAAQAEYNSLLVNKTWELTPRLPSMKILPCRWVFRVKANGTYKARVVVKGFLQQHGIDYDDIFAPVVRLEVLRLLFTLMSIHDLECHQMDVDTAFLNGTIDHEIYMSQPPGDLIDPASSDLVCRLRRSLYGLKQAPYLWYFTFVEFMTSQGYTRLHKDRCVFLKTTESSFTIVSLYVDDLLIFAPTLALVDTMKSALSARFSMKDLGPVSDILGWEVVRDRASRSVFLHQTRYTETVLERFGLSSATPSTTPFRSGVVLSTTQCATTPEDILFMATRNYRSSVGSLMYLAMGTRPDLAYTLQQLSQFLHNPGPDHWTASKRALRYLIGTVSHGIRLGGPSASTSQPFLSAYVDANYAMCVDTRRCISGFVSLFFGSPISWLAKKQSLVTLSTTEAEFVALALCIQELLYLRQLTGELGLTSSQPILIHEDNQSTIKIATNAELHGRSKHIDVRFMFVRDLIDSGEFDLKWCPTNDQLADFFTKAHPEPTFLSLRTRLGIIPLATFPPTLVT